MTCITSRFLNYKGFLLLGLLLAMVNESYSQQEPQYTQYMYNIGSFNPAYSATVEELDITGLYRAQWIDIEGAPRTLRFGLNYPLENDKMGLGFNVQSDQLGPTTNTFVDISYSYQLMLSANTKLSFGIDVGGSFLNVDFSKGDFENPGEPISRRFLPSPCAPRQAACAVSGPTSRASRRAPSGWVPGTRHARTRRCPALPHRGPRQISGW